jgi:hypothetical protein
MTLKSISLAAIESLLPELEEQVRAAVGHKNRPLPDAGARRDVLAAAALLDEFDPYALPPAVAGGQSDEWLPHAEELTRLSTPVARADGERRWRMRTPERQRILAQLVADGDVAAVIQRTTDEFGLPVNPVLAGYLRGSPEPLADLPADRLREAVQAFEVLRDLSAVPDARSDAAATEARLERADLLATLRALAAGRFAGRTRELADLAAYTGLARPADGDPSAAALAADERPLLVHGLGGMGKSTLLAEFLLREVLPGGEPRCPFAYLDFDRRTLSIEYPATLLYEAVDQIAAFYPAARESLLDAQARWQRDLRAGGDNRMQSDLESVSFSAGRQTGRFVHEFCQEVGRLVPAGGPFVLVLDTFEEVQSRSEDYVGELSSFLTVLKELLATVGGGCRLRVVLSGRTPAPELGARPYPLGALTQDAAEAFLVRLGVDPGLAPRVAGQLRGVPLALRVAADLVTRAQDEVLARGEFDGLHPVWYDLQDAEIQGLLIERYLKQVGDDDVRRLAHPGLVLRRITPAVIREVLAGPCGLTFADPTAAGERGGPGRHTPETLFRALSREVSLVFRERDGVLKNLPEVRAVLLGLLTRDGRAAKKVRRIHQNAVAYYEKFPDPESRAEEIYHRLQLGQSEKTIRPRWLPGVEPLLTEGLGELPPPSRAILAGRLDRAGELDADPRKRAEIDQPNWERYAARRAGRQLTLNQPADALATVRERGERLPGSRLFPLEVTALKHLQDWTGMRTVAARGVASAADAGNPKLAYELGRQLIQAILLSGDFAAAPAAIAAARDLTIRGDPARQLAFDLELDLAEIRVAHATGGVDPTSAAVLEANPAAVPSEAYDRAADRLSRLMAGKRATAPAELARTAAGLLGPRRPAVVRDIVRRYGVADGPLNPPRRRLLCRALVTWDEISSANRRRPDGVLADAAGRSGVTQTAEEWWIDLLDTRGAGINDVIGSLLDRFGLPDNALRRFEELFRLPPETELFAPLHTRLLDAMPRDELARFVADEMGQDLSEITKGTDRRDVARQLLSWAYEQGRFQELVDRLAARTHPSA